MKIEELIKAAEHNLKVIPEMKLKLLREIAVSVFKDIKFHGQLTPDVIKALKEIAQHIKDDVKDFKKEA